MEFTNSVTFRKFISLTLLSNYMKYYRSILIFSDIYSNVVDENIEFFRKIKLNLKDYRILYSFLAKYQSKLKSKMESTIISFDYQFKNIEKKKVFDE